MRDELQRENGLFWVAERGAELIGYLAASRVLDELEILQIGTEPSLRRVGIASRLLSTSLALALKTDCRVVLLEVRDSNQSARDFYARHGFRVFGRRRGYYARPAEDAVLMMRDLTSEAQ